MILVLMNSFQPAVRKEPEEGNTPLHLAAEEGRKFEKVCIEQKGQTMAANLYSCI